MSRVLVVEDEKHLAEGLRFNLEAEGHQWNSRAKGKPRSSACCMPKNISMRWSST